MASPLPQQSHHQALAKLWLGALLSGPVQRLMVLGSVHPWLPPGTLTWNRGSVSLSPICCSSSPLVWPTRPAACRRFWRGCKERGKINTGLVSKP